MSPTILYMLKVNVAISLLYLLYVALLKRDTFFSLRRYYLLFAIAFSFLFPFLTISSLGNIWSALSSSKGGDVEVSVMIGEPTMSVIMDDVEASTSVINWQFIIIAALVSVSLFLFIRFIVQLISIYRIWKKSSKQNIFDTYVYVVNQDITPFSFFKLIFINNENHTHDELNQILLHEQTHAKQWHSIDNVIIAVVNIVFWWNPFVWLIKREMIMNLEYLADNKVLNKGVDISEYQYHLVKLTYHETAAHLVNNFNVSQLKQRIIMMNKSKTPGRKLIKYLSIIPLALLLISVNSIYAAQNAVENVEVIEEYINTELQDPPPVRRNVKLDEVFVVVEAEPEFPGGQEAMMKYIADNLKYPIEAIKNGFQGRVVCNMVILKDGSIVNVEVEKGVDPLLDAEAVRIIESMPKWNPGKQRGNEVNVKYTIPIVFRLSPNNHGMLKFDVSEDMKEVVVTTDVNSDKKADAPDEIFVVVENNPEFPGGNEAMNKFLAENVKYPVIAQENGIQGRVICTMIINKDGSISDVEVVRGVDPSLDKEAIRVIELMPKWKPGTQRGNEVAVRYTLPVEFRLQTGDNTNNTQLPASGSALMKYLTENIRYPVIAQENHTQGLVKAIFRTDESGKAEVTDIDGDDALVKEVRRVITSTPQSILSASGGGSKKAAYMTSFIFRLQGDEGSNFKSYDGEMPENAIVIVGYANNKK